MGIEREKADFVGRWTIFDPGNATWQQRLAYGARFEITQDAAGNLELVMGRGVSVALRAPATPTFVASGQTTGTEARLVVEFPGLGRAVTFTVRTVGAGRMIDLISGDEDGHDDHDHNHDHDPKRSAGAGWLALAIKHGGPHGVDG